LSYCLRAPLKDVCRLLDGERMALPVSVKYITTTKSNTLGVKLRTGITLDLVCVRLYKYKCFLIAEDNQDYCVVFKMRN